MSVILFVRRADIDEEAVVAVKVGIAQRLAIDRDQALALLAGRLGDQLLGPCAKIRDFRGRQDRDLVAAFATGETHGKAELSAGIIVRGYFGAAGSHHGEGVPEQFRHVDSRGRGRDQPEGR